MKYYTAEEAAKKLKVSPGHIYELVKRGEIQKREGMGRAVRIPSSELSKVSTERNYFTYNSEKIEVIQTHLGKVRKVKNSDLFICVDIIKAIGIKDSYAVSKVISKEQMKLFNRSEAKELGIVVNRCGILTISHNGLKEYSMRSICPINWAQFLEELMVSQQILIDEVVEEKEVKTNQLQVIEERELLGKDFKIYGTLENPLFLARDVAEWIEHSQSIKMIENVDKEEKVMNIVHTLGGNQSAWFLTEDGLYEVLMQSRKPIAKEFKKEVKKILKQIRLTGGYVGNSTKFVDNYFSNLSKDTRKIILSELENKNKTLMAERVKIDKELLDNIEVIEKIQETL